MHYLYRQQQFSQLTVIALRYDELAFFHHFVEHAELPLLSVKDIVRSRFGSVKCVVAIPDNVEPGRLQSLWLKWRNEERDAYARLN